VFDYKQQNTFSIRVRTTDLAGFSFEKVIVITVSEKPTVIGTNSPQYYGSPSGTPVISKGFSSSLQIQGSGVASVRWSPTTGLSNPNIINPVANPKVTTTYTITITNTFGSVTTIQVTVEVKDDYWVEPQNIITPNGDGINDFFTVKNLVEYPINELTIYNREGKILTRISNYNERWDGKINGRPLSTGTYYYVLRFPGNQKAVYKGFVTIVNPQ
jgi:gliding motility-associated-like protein